MVALDSGEPAEVWTPPTTAPDDYADQVFLWCGLSALLKIDQSPLLRAYAREALALALRRGWLEYTAEGHFVLGRDSYEAGRLAEAERDLTTSYNMWQAMGAPKERGAGMIVAVLVEQGRLDDAEEMLISCGHRDSPADRLRPFPYLLYARGTWKAANGDDHSAAIDFHASGAAHDGRGQLGPLVPGREHAALSLQALGHVQEARELVADALRPPGLT
jgi:hypothetical protein